MDDEDFMDSRRSSIAVEGRRSSGRRSSGMYRRGSNMSEYVSIDETDAAGSDNSTERVS